MPEHHLIFGGARSGKTAFALRAAEALGARRTYIATGEAFDDEMAARIAAHKAERAAGWQTVEEPRVLASAIRGATECDVVLVDCLTLWLSNLMHHGHDLEAETAGLLSALVDASVPVLLVSNEVGLSIVPENTLARAFRDAQGRLNQAVAAAVPRATFFAAGLPLCLKTPE